MDPCFVATGNLPYTTSRYDTDARLPGCMPPAIVTIATLPTMVYSAVVLSPDGQYLAHSVGLRMKLSSVSGLDRKVSTLNGDTALAFSPDSSKLISASKETLRIWNVSDGALTVSVRHSYSLYAGTFSPDGQILALGTTQDTEPANGDGIGTVLLCDFSALTISGELKYEEIVGTTGFVGVMAFSPDGKQIAFVSGDSLCLHNQGDESAIVLEQTGYLSTRSVTFSSNGPLFVVRKVKSFHLWDARKQKEAFGIPCGALAVALSPDGSRLAATDTRTVRLYNVSNGERSHRVEFAGANLLSWRDDDVLDCVTFEKEPGDDEHSGADDRYPDSRVALRRATMDCIEEAIGDYTKQLELENRQLKKSLQAEKTDCETLRNTLKRIRGALGDEEPGAERRKWSRLDQISPNGTQG